MTVRSHTIGAIVTGIVFGTVPAWRLSRSDPGDALRGGSLPPFHL